jgi:hypothetical protein
MTSNSRCPYCSTTKIIHNIGLGRNTYGFYYSQKPGVVNETPCSRRIYLVVVKEEYKPYETGIVYS